MTQILPIVLAGGGGTRLWPLSRSHYPKQFLAVRGTQTLLQSTLTRVGAGALAEATVLAPYVVCNETHRFLVGEQARLVEQIPARIILEPVGRNTAPALTCAALLARAAGDDPLLLMMPADHLIMDVAKFCAAVQQGVAQALRGQLVTFGVVPQAAETGYGYIQLGARLSTGNTEGPEVTQLQAFKEKPDVATAEAYLNDGAYRWNAGIFLMQASVWLAAIREFNPAILAACDEAVSGGQADGEFFRLEQVAFTRGPSDSIDYAVMEPLATYANARVSVVSLDAGWSDVGSWSSLWEVCDKDKDNNVLRGDSHVFNCSRSVVFSESRMVAALGVDDLVIVETADAVMVAPRARAQEVKTIVDWLQAHNREERLTHRRVYRPWGSYEGIDGGERFQVKRIIVNPGAALSLQMHHHRAEHWIIVKGTAQITRDEDVFLLTENQSTYIPLGAKHRLENPGAIPLEMIEVQSGAYLGEDDIVRFEDIYNRT